MVRQTYRLTDTVGSPADEKYSQRVVYNLEKIPQGPNNVLLHGKLYEKVGEVHHGNETCTANGRQYHSESVQRD